MHQAMSIMTNTGQQQGTASMVDLQTYRLAMDLKMELVLGKLSLIMFISCRERYNGEVYELI